MTNYMQENFDILQIQKKINQTSNPIIKLGYIIWGTYRFYFPVPIKYLFFTFAVSFIFFVFFYFFNGFKLKSTL
jgi:hypothetical protein